MERSPVGRHSCSRARASRRKPRPRWAAGRLGSAIGIAAVVGLVLPAASAGAAPASTPTLKQLLAQASKLSFQIDNLSQQYDALRIQLAQAQAQIRIARLTLRRDQQLLSRATSSLGLVAAAGYMTGGLNPALQLLTSENPQAMLNRASILTELQQENGAKVSLVSAARDAATRARLLAVQEMHQAARLSSAMQARVARIQAREGQLNSAAFNQAMAIYQQTGQYPPIHVTGDSVGVQALRYALTRVGDPYIWGAAGPSAFDCSGLVVWSFAQIGISLPHYTGYLWNSGVHVSRSQLEPGDLVFFFPDIGHVGIYVGGGMMVDAPTYGQPVQVQPVFWSAYVGAVRIA